MNTRNGASLVGGSVVGAIAGFVTRPCCIGPAILSFAGLSSAGFATVFATYHSAFVSLGALMLAASLWVTFRRDGGWFNKIFAASTTMIAFSWSMGRMGGW